MPGAIVDGINSGVFGGFVPFAAHEFAGKILRASGVINFPDQRFRSGGGGCTGNGAKAQRFERPPAPRVVWRGSSGKREGILALCHGRSRISLGGELFEKVGWDYTV